ncbi:hypothetical protein APHAL10511_000123 [Amanita phalloides]|nr:hypothetical protein APHAL10511_000123 [Amanita phalloides]
MSQILKDVHFVQLLAENYTRVKTLFPQEGRRKWHLRVLQSFWAEHQDSMPPPHQSSKVPADEFVRDIDTFDKLLDGEEPGIVLRTDYSDDSAWENFCSKLQDGEEEMKAYFTSTDGNEGPDADEHMEDTDSSASEESADTPNLVKVIDTASPELRAILNNISNLTALRLFNDVDIRSSPTPPQGVKRIKPPNRLIDQGGWQETYNGRTIWIYDAQSNSDQCTRLVSARNDMYGTATGDSWRARVTHIYRWDLSERKRNLEEAALLPW